MNHRVQEPLSRMVQGNVLVTETTMRRINEPNDHCRCHRHHFVAFIACICLWLTVEPSLANNGSSSGEAKRAGDSLASRTVADSISSTAVTGVGDSAAARRAGSTAASPQDSSAVHPSDHATAPGLPGPDDPPVARPFHIGESLKFSIQYGPIKAGTAVLSVEGVEEVGGKECYRLVSVAQSNRIFSPIYKVRDRIVSLVDVRYLITRRTAKALREKDYEIDQSIDWDHEKGKLLYHDGTTLDLVPGARDVLGAFYYVRTLPLSVGASIPVSAHDNRKSYPLVINVVGMETIDTPLGRFRCWVVEPKLLTDGLFRRSGSLRVWITNDAERLPVMMQSAVKVGAISAILVEMRRGDRREPEFGLNVN